jgi:hypothetical protein
MLLGEGLRAERSWEIQRIGNPEVSPDGRQFVAPVSRRVMEDQVMTPGRYSQPV